jgi:hypothetical protein
MGPRLHIVQPLSGSSHGLDKIKIGAYRSPCQRDNLPKQTKRARRFP